MPSVYTLTQSIAVIPYLVQANPWHTEALIKCEQTELLRSSNLLPKIDSFQKNYIHV